MRVMTLREAEASMDIDVKMVSVRSSRYRVFGSAERIADGELAVVDLRDGIRPGDFESRFAVLDRHPMAEVLLVRRLA